MTVGCAISYASGCIMEDRWCHDFIDSCFGLNVYNCCYSRIFLRLQCFPFSESFFYPLWTPSPSTLPIQVTSVSYLAWKTGSRAENTRAGGSLQNWSGVCAVWTLNNNSQGEREERKGMGGLRHSVLNNILFQAPERSGQMNSSPPWSNTSSEQSMCGVKRLSRYCIQQHFTGLMASAGSPGVQEGERGAQTVGPF